jgi:hypothetical protein
MAAAMTIQIQVLLPPSPASLVAIVVTDVAAG